MTAVYPSQTLSNSAIRKFIETKLSAISFFVQGPPIEYPAPIAERLPRFINKKNVLLIVGETGTRKEILLKKIVIPCLERFQGFKNIVTNYCTGEDGMHLNFDQVTIFYNFEQLRAKDQALILSKIKDTDNAKDQNPEEKKFKYVFISNASNEELSRKFQKGMELNFYSFVKSGITIELPNIRELFYKLPQIIKLLIKDNLEDQEYKIEDVNFNLIEYLEVLLEGINDNFHGLERIISNISVNPPNPLHLEFSNLLSISEQKVTLWQLLIKNVSRIKLIQLIEFNSKYTGVLKWVDVQSPNKAKSEFHKEKQLDKRLYYYINATVKHFGGNSIDKKTWKALYDKKESKVKIQGSDLFETETDHQTNDLPIKSKESSIAKGDKKKESIKLLLKLKEKDYKPIYSEQELMKDRSFLPYRSHFMNIEHIYEPLKDIFDNLKEFELPSDYTALVSPLKYITYDDFNNIVNAPSPYFERLLFESFRRLCNYKNGRFHSKTPGKVILNKKRKIDGELKKVILFIK